MSSSTTSPSQPITRSLFISPDVEKVASNLPTMVVFRADGRGVEEVPVPASVKESGVIPEGFCVEMMFDPHTAVVALAKRGITDTSQLEQEMLEEMIAVINTQENMRIVPKAIYDNKLAMTVQALQHP
jgi:hypothetical protein